MTNTLTVPKRPSPNSRGDGVFRAVIIGLSLIIIAVFLLSIFLLGRDSLPALREFGFGFLTQTVWNPVTKQFGAGSMIAGTLITAFAALVISVPLALASAIFVAEYAPKWLANPVSYLVELLAAVPSVVYGLWALFALKPILQSFQLFLFTRNPDLVTQCSTLHGNGQNSFACFFMPEAPTGQGSRSPSSS